MLNGLIKYRDITMSTLIGVDLKTVLRQCNMAKISDTPPTVAGCQQLADPTPTSMQSAESQESSAESFCSHQAELTHRTPVSLHLNNRQN